MPRVIADMRISRDRLMVTITYLLLDNQFLTNVAKEHRPIPRELRKQWAFLVRPSAFFLFGKFQEKEAHRSIFSFPLERYRTKGCRREFK